MRDARKSLSMNKAEADSLEGVRIFHVACEMKKHETSRVPRFIEVACCNKEEAWQLSLVAREKSTGNIVAFVPTREETTSSRQ